MKNIKTIVCWMCLICTLPVSAQLRSAGTPYPLGAQGRLRSTLSMPYITLPTDSLEGIQEAHSKVFYTGKVSNVGLAPQHCGEHIQTADGTKVWRIGFTGKGASSIGLVLDSVDIPEGALFFLYNPRQNRVAGGFNSQNNNAQGILPLMPFDGDSVVLEYQEPANAAYSGHFRVAQAAQNYTNTRILEKYFYSAASCSPHANCWNQLPQAARGTCILYVTSSTRTWRGTGILLNNPNGEPYLYTAAHNLSQPGCAERTVFYFNYQVPAADTLVQGSEEFTIAGATLLSLSSDLDMALAKLNQMPPNDYRPFLAGWNAESTPQGPYLCIQHPMGDCQRVSQTTSITVGTYDGGDLSETPVTNGFWKVSRWSKGTTEAGSSGSGLIDRNGMVIGALTGGASTCALPYNDYFARLGTAWDYHSEQNKQLKHWLDPNNTGLRSMEGVDPYEASATCQRVGHTQLVAAWQTQALSDGYLAGHNQWQHKAFAEHFDTDSGAWVYGAYVVPAKGSYLASSPVYLKLYDGGNVPNNELASAVIHPQYSKYSAVNGTFINTSKTNPLSNKENYVRFEQPIRVGKDYFVGIEISYASADSFALYSASTQSNLAYYQQSNGTWNAYTNRTMYSGARSLWIEPVLSYTKPSSVGEATQTPTVGIYPNPVSNFLYVETAGQPVSYRIYNLQGRLVLQGNESPADCSRLEKGIYLLYWNDGKDEGVAKIIKLP